MQLEPAEARAAVTALLGVEQKALRGGGGGSLSVSPLAAAAVRRRFGFSFCFILFCSVLGFGSLYLIWFGVWLR